MSEKTTLKTYKLNKLEKLELDFLWKQFSNNELTVGQFNTELTKLEKRYHPS